MARTKTAVTEAAQAEQNVIDLSGPVTAGQFQAALQALWETRTTVFLPRLGSDTIPMMRGLSSRFPENLDVPAVEITDPDTLPDEWLTDAGRAGQAERNGERYRSELETIRKRLLSLVNGGYFTMEVINEIFTAMQLPVYTAEPAPARGYYSAFTVYLASDITSRHEVASMLGSGETLTGKLQEMLKDTGLTVRSVSREPVHVDHGYQPGMVPVADNEPFNWVYS